MKNYKTVILLISTVVIIIAGVYYIVVKTKKPINFQQDVVTSEPNQINNENNQQADVEQKSIEHNNKENKEATKSIQTQNQNDEIKLFKNQYFSIKILPGWSVEELRNGSVNIEKDNYILYVNPKASQASGVKGGRFDEISNGSPSADLVTKFRPAEACSPLIRTKTSKFTRIDIYVDKNSNETFCKHPTDNKRHWYFSYYVKDDGYFNYVEGDDFHPYAITVSIKTDNINDLPVVDDAVLARMLHNTDIMVDSVQIFKQNSN